MKYCMLELFDDSTVLVQASFIHGPGNRIKSKQSKAKQPQNTPPKKQTKQEQQTNKTETEMQHLT